MTKASYFSLLIEGNSENLEPAMAFLFEAGCMGTEETSDDRVKAYFPSDVDLDRLTVELAANFPGLSLGPIEPIKEEDWSSTWKKDFHGFPVGEGFFVLPSWEPPPRTERILLRIDPERAFGTGTHDTTRLCLELVEGRARAGMSLIDAGTGTGILAIAAAALGCSPVIAVEADAEAATCARANVSRNRFEHVVQIRRCSVSEASPAEADIVVGNLNASIIKKNLVRLTSWVEPEGTLILSGILVEQVDDIVSELPSDFHLSQQRTAGGWAALAFRRSSHA